MDAQAFWEVIGQYNQATIVIQCILFLIIVSASIITFVSKLTVWAKAALGITNLFIGVVFFCIYGTEPIQKFFALPLYLICGFIFLYEALRNRKERLNKTSVLQIILLILYILYPLTSYLLGNRFPQMVTHIMPCPVVSLSIAIYASCPRKNIVLLALLTVWGLTGVKSVIFNAYEDIILLICGVYGVYLLVKEISDRKHKVCTV